jgi:hypothetical protein
VGGKVAYSASEAVSVISSHVPLVVVTDGARGSCVGVRGQVSVGVGGWVCL